MRNLTIGILVASSFLYSCNYQEQSEKPTQFVNITELEKLVKFETIEKGYFAKEGEGLCIARTQKEGEELWSKTSNFDIPKVDFGKNIVIGVYLGEKPTGGYEIEIKKVIEEGNQTKVYVQKISPSPDEIIIDILTNPYHIVKIPKTKNKVVVYKIE